MASGTLLGAWSAGYWEMFRDLHDPPNGPRIKEVAFLFLLCAAKIVLKFYAYQYPMVSLTIGPNFQVDHHLPQKNQIIGCKLPCLEPSPAPTASSSGRLVVEAEVMKNNQKLWILIHCRVLKTIRFDHFGRSDHFQR